MRRKVLAGLTLAACGACARIAPGPATPQRQSPETSVSEIHVSSCARTTDAPLPARLPGARQGSGIALARGEQPAAPLLAYVVDADSRSIHTLSVDEHHQLGRTRLADAPAQVLVMPDGRVVATLPQRSRLTVLEPSAQPDAPMKVLCERPMPAEPWGLALSGDDATLVVTSAWAARVSMLRASDFTTLRSVGVARDPRSVVIDASGQAFVSHGVGATLSLIDLDRDDAQAKELDVGAYKASARSQPKDMAAERTASQGYALAKVERADADGRSMTRILAPMTSVDPGEISRPSAVYYGPPFDGIPKVAPFVSVVDPATRQPLGRALVAATDTRFSRECLLPRAAAARGKTGSLYVTCLGIDALLELDAWALDPFHAERRRFEVPPGPQGVAVDEASGRAVVFSQMGGAVTVVDLDGHEARAATIPIDYHPDPRLADAAYGRLLFYRTDDTRISNDGVACASCHVDGRDDGVTWSTPTGPRQTPMLAGRVQNTAPYGWEGERATLADYVGNTVHNLGGKGLDTAELDAIAKFLVALDGPLVPAPAASPDARVAHGKELFADTAQECAVCHTGETSTDGALHDISKAAGDFVPGFDTPSLHFVAGTAPYFHDGRYASLEALLADPSSHMGHSATLSDEDRAALAAYLRSL